MEHSLAQGLVGMMSLFLCERLLLVAVLLLPVVVSIHRLSLRRTHHLISVGGLIVHPVMVVEDLRHPAVHLHFQVARGNSGVARGYFGL